jgi:hypothetical protein
MNGKGGLIRVYNRKKNLGGEPLLAKEVCYDD